MNWELILNHLPALPEMVLLVGACAVMLVDVYSKDERRTATYAAAQCVLLACLLSTAFVLYGSPPAGTQRYVLFEGLFVADLMGHVLKLVCYGAVSAALVYSRQYLLDRGLMRGEFVSLLLFSLLGMMVMISANSFLTAYLGLELMSLCLYAMVALDRDSPLATEAAMKYFILGALSSGLLLYGMSMIYGATGTLTINEVAGRLAVLSSDADRQLQAFGLVFVVAGIAFKIGVVPFHMWIPDVYHGAPTPVTLVLGSGPKLAAFAMAMRLLVNGMLPLAQDWQQMLALLALLSMALGNITAIAQTNIKRMLAYSTISHVGFILLGILAGTNEGYRAAMFYTLTYVIVSTGSFGVILLLSRQGFEADELSDYKGLNRKSPWFAAIMMMLMFSTAGVPPFVGFWAKLAVLGAVVDVGFSWLAVVAVGFSVIGAFFYLRVIKLMYFDEPADTNVIEAGGTMRAVLSANGLAALALGIFPSVLMELCARVLP
jgi:NADH-quinone oxidoreductase subunit N